MKNNDPKSASPAVRFAKCPTGIQGLDEITGGGLPRARHVTVRLRQQGAFVQLAIKDDGISFDPADHPANQTGQGGLDLFCMRERASYMGGALKVKSARGAGTEIEVRVPVPAGALAAN